MGGFAFQKRNSDRANLLATDFERKASPSLAWGTAMSCMQLTQTLRGLWPMSSVDENGAVYDISEQGRVLTNNNAATFGTWGLCPYVEFNGTTQYLHRNDEPGLEPGQGPLTVWCWARFDDSAPANAEVVMAKWDETSGNQREWRLLRRSNANGRNARFQISTDGTAIVTVTSAGALVEDTWYFLAARFYPTTEINVWVYDVEARNVALIPGSIFDGTARFTIGAEDTTIGATLYMDGKVTLAGMCMAYLPDVVIQTLYHRTRALFNV